MPHFITIIKYEFNIVKYILAVYHTIVGLRESAPQRGVYQNEPILWPTLTRSITCSQKHLRFYLYHGEAVEPEIGPIKSFKGWQLFSLAACERSGHPF